MNQGIFIERQVSAPVIVVLEALAKTVKRENLFLSYCITRVLTVPDRLGCGSVTRLVTVFAESDPVLLRVVSKLAAQVDRVDL
jgi:hypothetical protein